MVGPQYSAQDYIPAAWDAHLEGELPEIVFCDDLFCWCHMDQRKLAFVGNLLANDLIDQSQAGRIEDGLKQIDPTLLMVEAMPQGFIKPQEEDQHGDS